MIIRVLLLQVIAPRLSAHQFSLALDSRVYGVDITRKESMALQVNPGGVTSSKKARLCVASQANFFGLELPMCAQAIVRATRFQCGIGFYCNCGIALFSNSILKLIDWTVSLRLKAYLQQLQSAIFFHEMFCSSHPTSISYAF